MVFRRRGYRPPNNTGRYFPRSAAVRRGRRKTTIVKRNARRRPTRYGNRKGMMANSMAIRSLRNFQFNHMVYTDYLISVSWNIPGRTFYCFPLVNPITPVAGVPGYTEVMRRNATVLRDNTTYIKRLTLNLSAFLEADQNAVTWNIFIVRMRSGYSTVNLEQYVNAGSMADNVDYILPLANSKITLSAGKYHVMKHYYFTLSTSRVVTTGVTPLQSGTPSSTWRRIQLSLPVRHKVTNQQNGGSWRDLNSTNVPWYKQYYLLAVNDSTLTTATFPFFWSSLMTCINTD